jgi:hypothetical protein
MLAAAESGVLMLLLLGVEDERLKVVEVAAETLKPLCVAEFLLLFTFFSIVGCAIENANGFLSYMVTAVDACRTRDPLIFVF